MSDPKTESEESAEAFERWWAEEYELAAESNPDRDFIKRMCATAWENGAFKQRERDERK